MGWWPLLAPTQKSLRKSPELWQVAALLEITPWYMKVSTWAPLHYSEAPWRGWGDSGGWRQWSAVKDKGDFHLSLHLFRSRQAIVGTCTSSALKTPWLYATENKKTHTHRHSLFQHYPLQGQEFLCWKYTLERNRANSGPVLRTSDPSTLKSDPTPWGWWQKLNRKKVMLHTKPLL